MKSIDDHLDEQEGSYALIKCDDFRGEYRRPYGYSKEYLIELLEDVLFSLKGN